MVGNVSCGGAHDGFTGRNIQFSNYRKRKSNIVAATFDLRAY